MNLIEFVVDLLFAAAAAIPGGLLLVGRPDVAVLIFCPLLFAACLTAMWFRDAPLLGEKRLTAPPRDR